MGNEDGDGIIFDYDMAIAEPFNQRNDGAAPAFDMWPLYRKLGRRAAADHPRRAQRLALGVGGASDGRGAPDAELVTVPGVGHAPELNEPEAVAAIDRLLEQGRAGRLTSS